MSTGAGTAGRLETHLVESRRHPPDPAFAAQANVGLDVAARAAADPVAFWEAQAHRLQWDAPWHTALDWRPATPGPDGELSVPAARWFDGFDELKVVVVSGRGRAFSAGADVSSFGSGEDVGRPPRDDADSGWRMARAMDEMRAVTVAKVQGWCVGGGLVLAGVCDLRVAGRSARFSIPEV